MRWLRILALKFAASELEKVEQYFSTKAALEDERRARAALEITSASVLQNNEFLRIECVRAQKAERDALHLLANIGFQKQFGVKPYADQVGLPEANPKEEVEQPGPARIQGVDMVRQGKQRFLDELARREAAGEAIPVDRQILEQALAAL